MRADPTPIGASDGARSGPVVRMCRIVIQIQIEIGILRRSENAQHRGTGRTRSENVGRQRSPIKYKIGLMLGPEVQYQVYNMIAIDTYPKLP